MVDRLRTAFGDAEGKVVFKSDDLRPPPAACSFRTSPFVVTVGRVSVQRGPTQGGDPNDGVYTLQVAVTAWAAYAPWDRQSLETAGPTDQSGFAQESPAEAVDGIEETADAVAAYLQEDWATVVAANARVPGYAAGTANGFCEPFHTHAVGDVEDAPPSWVHSEGKDDSAPVKKIVVTLSGARRIRVQGTR
ncbi:MAG: hypothetical protein VKJ09_15605 [Leptolyngbya sp.]|nr:hypothetical protein [Leptolyngbya sp.]